MGVNIKEGENGTAYTMSLTLKGCDPYAKERATSEMGVYGQLYNFLLDLQNKLLDTAETNSSKWFGKSRTRSVLEELMKQSVSPSVEKVNGEWVATGKYPPSLRMKVPVYNGDVAMDVINSQGKPVEVTIDNLTTVFPKRFRASLVVSPSVYVSGQGFGMTWRVTYARVSPPQRTTAADVFADEIKATGGFEEEVPQQVQPQTETLDAEQEQEEVSVPIVEETPTAPPPAPAVKNRRRVVAN